MKHTTLFVALTLGSFTAFGQGAMRQAPVERTHDDNIVKVMSADEAAMYYGTETPVWSEDFANGIPSTWGNSGTANGVSDPDAVWEYRGPNTTPSNATGSQGAYGSANPLQSATASNGFVLFDSDYLDNAGIAGNFGNGAAAAPHVADLTTDMIDLSSYSIIDLTFTQYYRRFAGPGGSQAVPATYIEFSTDGGSTWPSTVMLNSAIGVNSSTSLNDVVSISIGSYVGGQDSVKVRFRFDGDYYVWMVDDIQIINTPPNRLAFTDYNGAPAQDILFGPDANGASSRMGITTLKQARSMKFDANVVNSGTNNQSNVQLSVEIYNGSSLVQTVSSSTVSTLNAGDTANYNSLNTYSSAWTPSAAGNYTFVYLVNSDSVSLASDTFNFYVTDSLMSMDFNSWDNSIGASSNTSQWGDGSQVCNRHDLVDNELLFGSRVWLSSSSEPGAVIELAVYDSAGWDAANGGFLSSNLIAYGQHTLTSTDTANGFVQFDFADPNTGRGADMLLSNGAYFYNITMYDNQGANHIRLRNDASWGKVSGSGYMYLAALGNWYSGYSGSRSFNNIWVRGITCPDVACMGTNVEEQQLEDITLMPNPATDYVTVDFGMAAGMHTVTMIDMTGKVVKQVEVLASADAPIFVGDLNTGMYMVQIQKDDFVKTIKLAVK